MRHLLEHEVGGHEVLGIWDGDLDKGRIIWINGETYDLMRPRDDHYIERIIAKGEAHDGPEQAEPAPTADPSPDGQLSLFG